MSKYQLIISPRAAEDLKSIYTYTLEAHGANQADKYLAKIEHAFKGLLDNPEIGRDRSDVKLGYRSLNIEKHVCFYKIVEEQIQLLGVPHGRMDVVSYIADIEH